MKLLDPLVGELNPYSNLLKARMEKVEIIIFDEEHLNLLI